MGGLQRNRMIALLSTVIIEMGGIIYSERLLGYQSIQQIYYIV